jgi:hypothetical protein
VNFLDGKRTLVHGKTGRTWEMQKTKDAIGWMANFFSKVTDKMPHKEQFVLPITYDKMSVYKRMIHELDENNENVTYQHFFSLWKKNHHNVIIGKVSEKYLIVNKNGICFYCDLAIGSLHFEYTVVCKIFFDLGVKLKVHVN